MGDGLQYPISSLDTICVVVIEKGSKKSDEETLRLPWGRPGEKLEMGSHLSLPNRVPSRTIKTQNRPAIASSLFAACSLARQKQRESMANEESTLSSLPERGNEIWNESRWEDPSTSGQRVESKKEYGSEKSKRNQKS